MRPRLLAAVLVAEAGMLAGLLSLPGHSSPPRHSHASPVSAPARVSWPAVLVAHVHRVTPVVAPPTTTTTTTTPPAPVTTLPAPAPASPPVEAPAVTEAPAAPAVPGVQTVPNWQGWELVAQCETGGNWAARGPEYSGGLGMTNQNWVAFGGTQFAWTAATATPAEQMIVANRVEPPPWSDTPAGGCHGW